MRGLLDRCSAAGLVWLRCGEHRGAAIDPSELGSRHKVVAALGRRDVLCCRSRVLAAARWPGEVDGTTAETGGVVAQKRAGHWQFAAGTAAVALALTTGVHRQEGGCEAPQFVQPLAVR